MFGIQLIPENTKINFISIKNIVFGLSIILMLFSITTPIFKGMNFGIDFKGGYLIEVKSKKDKGISDFRKILNDDTLGLGEIKLQEADTKRDIMIRIEKQDDKSQESVVNTIKTKIDSDVESYRRIESVGSKVSGELMISAIQAIIFALLAMFVYIWLRFEWQFSVGAVVAQIHDVIAVVGLYAIMGLEVNETAIVAILTTLGYSINDTVVIYDRIRENLRKYKKKPMQEIINISTNETLSRTVLTSGTTLLALFALYFFGGTVIENFILPIIAGVIVGTYSSIFLASPLLMHMHIERSIFDEEEKTDEEKEKAEKSVTEMIGNYNE